MDLKENMLSRYQLVQKIIQDFWKRWSGEYLSTLQTRGKWTTEQENAKEGDVVLIKGENLPPTHWRMGIIEKIYPGRDGKIRMATVRTKNGNMDRPIIKLVPLIEIRHQRGENGGGSETKNKMGLKEQ